ncbi:glutathione ABC superfamily ATP binding cassette transporter, permease protein [Candidatus Endolissoclinum faulkneri L5]|uniref:Glutathione ABC superfamily ATP binding cassette transporter, permease protein n=1 Tax=Candidatus Endolissoclinum faulkneri L5 TaxID=1401328 RepID=V9TR96_9PROT|nr:ABC transporter permease [Candidatus Endolissoclinum faulkneri]AHC73424.1 glutathione ABC superfamily ATP binding cassette transporter, permease protein [Candidatus Endolissoclinum faulkneri L5]
MFGFVVNRLLATIPVMMIVTIFVFLFLRLAPGDPAAVLAGDNGSPQQIIEIRERLGLNQPVLVQFGTWILGIAKGDFGKSYFFKKQVSELILLRVEPTIALATTTLIITILVAIPIGVIAAYKHDTWIDWIIMTLSVVGFSIPAFVLGYILIYLFAIEINLFPVQGYKPLAEGFWPFLHQLILPSLTISAIYIALIARITRASILEVLGEDYIRTAYAKGLKPNSVLLKHALRNAAVPIVTVIGIGIALLTGGVIVTESVYNIPGIGRLIVDAVLNRDYPTIQAIVILFSFFYVIVNLLVDLTYSLLDPRIRY